MAATIRLARFGKKRSPYYRIVVIDRLKARNAQYIDLIGQYAPMHPDENKQVNLNKDKVKDWLAKGATVSDAVKNILSSEGILEETASEGGRKKKKKYRKKRYNSLSEKIKLKEAEKKAEKDKPSVKKSSQEKQDKTSEETIRDKAEEKPLEKSEASEETAPVEDSQKSASDEAGDQKGD